MSLESEAKNIGEYVKWAAERKATAADVSPERFVVEKAKQEAFERVEAAIEYLEGLGAETWTDRDEDLYRILTGDDS